MNVLQSCWFALCCSFGFWLRLEPWRAFWWGNHSRIRSLVQYRVVEYAHLNGVWKLFSWRDERVWYPKGRFIGVTAFFGLAFVTLLVYRITCLVFGKERWTLMQVCVYIQPLFSAFACILCYFFAFDTLNCSNAGLYSALLAAVVQRITPVL